jgi:CDGSH-type Zn-finger protein
VSRHVRVRLCADGPLLVRGAGEVLDENGEAHPVTRPVVAVCACGRTSRSPWCDGTHQALEAARQAREVTVIEPDEAPM